MFLGVSMGGSNPCWYWVCGLFMGVFLRNPKKEKRRKNFEFLEAKVLHV